MSPPAIFAEQNDFNRSMMLKLKYHVKPCTVVHLCLCLTADFTATDIFGMT